MTQPGTYECTVAATVRSNRLIQDIYPYYIVYLRLLELDDFLFLKGELEEYTYLDYHSYQNNFLSGIIFDNQIKDNYHLPIKGEKVHVNIDYKNDKLKVMSIELLPRYELQRIDITEIFPLIKIFKTYLNEKSNNKQSISPDEGDTISEF